jgi:hypothetical protein
MTAESTSTTLVGHYNDAVVEMLTAPYAIDPNPFLAHVRAVATPPGTKVHSFPRVTKDTALSGTITEATGLSNTALDTANADATVAEVGILRQFTKFAERTNLLGTDGLHRLAYEDGTKMCLEKAETDLWAEASNASTSVGTSGAAFTIADFAAALSQHVINKSKGKVVFLLSATQGKNLRAEIASSGAAFLSGGSGDAILAQTAADGFMGTFMGSEVFTNNLAESSGANKLGLAMIDGSGPNPENCATAMSVAWMPEVAQLPNIVLSGGAQIAITMCYGIVEVIDYAYVGIATIA